MRACLRLADTRAPPQLWCVWRWRTTAGLPLRFWCSSHLGGLGTWCGTLKIQWYQWTLPNVFKERCNTTVWLQYLYMDQAANTPLMLLKVLQTSNPLLLNIMYVQSIQLNCLLNVCLDFITAYIPYCCVLWRLLTLSFHSPSVRRSQRSWTGLPFRFLSRHEETVSAVLWFHSKWAGSWKKYGRHLCTCTGQQIWTEGFVSVFV